MELVKIVFSGFKRFVGFFLICGVFYGGYYVLSPALTENHKLFLLGMCVVFIIAWTLYNTVVGRLETDIAILIRLIQVRGLISLSWIPRSIGNWIDAHKPTEIIEQHYEAVEWQDIEASHKIRRALSKQEITCLIGQYDGRAQFMNLVDVGAVYISAPPRSGKTNLITQMIASIMLGHPLAKKEIDFYFVDITRDLSLLAPLGKYTSNMTDAHKMLISIGGEIDVRNKLREKYELGGNYWYKISPQERPKPIILVIDEAIQVLKEGGKGLADAWSKIINIGHKNGILLITTTLYTRGDLIPTEFTSLMRAKIAGYMGTEQAFINMLDSDYYNKHKATINDYVNTKYRFALCVRPKHPEFFQPIYVPNQRLLELVQESVIDVDEWREVALSIWWNCRGEISAEELGRKTRDFVTLHGSPDKVNPECIHKKSTLDLLRHATLAKIARHNGQREHYKPECTSYNQLRELWDTYVLSGGLDKRVPSGKEMDEMKTGKDG